MIGVVLIIAGITLAWDPELVSRHPIGDDSVWQCANATHQSCVPRIQIRDQLPVLQRLQGDNHFADCTATFQRGVSIGQMGEVERL